MLWKCLKTCNNIKVKNSQELNIDSHPSSRKLRKILSLATFMNVAYGTFGATVGYSSGSSALLSDSFHSVADGASHAAHTGTHKAELDDNGKSNQYSKIKTKRRIAAGLIGAGALFSGYNAAMDLTDANADHELNRVALGVELGALAMNAGLYMAVKKNYDGSLAWKDAKRHHYTDALISTVAVTGIVTNPTLGWSDGTAGLIASSATGYLSYLIYKDTNKNHTPNTDSI